MLQRLLYEPRAVDVTPVAISHSFQSGISSQAWKLRAESYLTAY